MSGPAGGAGAAAGGVVDESQRKKGDGSEGEACAAYEPSPPTNAEPSAMDSTSGAPSAPQQPHPPQSQPRGKSRSGIGGSGGGGGKSAGDGAKSQQGQQQRGGGRGHGGRGHHHHHHHHGGRGRHHHHRHGDHQQHHPNKKGGPASGDAPARANRAAAASPPTSVIDDSDARRWFETLPSGKARAIALAVTDLPFLRAAAELARKGGLSAPGGGGGDRGDNGLEEKVSLGDLEGMMKRFRGGDGVLAISSSDAATPHGEGEATVAEDVSAVAITSDGVVARREAGARNGGLPLLSTEETDSLTRLTSVDLNSPPPHSKNCQGDGDASVQGLLDKEGESVVGGENTWGYDNNPKDIVMLSEALEVGTGDENEDQDNVGKDTVFRIRGKAETGEASKENMEEEGKYIIFKGKSVGAVADYEQDSKSIEKEGKDSDDAATTAVTVAVTAAVAAAVADAASTEEDRIAVKEVASATVVTATAAPSDEEVPAPATLHPTPTATAATAIDLCPTPIAAAAVPVVCLVPVTLHFESGLALPVLATANTAASAGAVVASISLAGRARRRPNDPVPVANKVASEGVNDGNDVDASPKFSALGGSASVANTKVRNTAEGGPLATAEGPAPVPVLAARNFVSTSGGGGGNGKKTNKKKKKSRAQRVADTRNAASRAVQELSGSKGTAALIATLTVTTADPKATMVPLPSSAQTATPAIAPASLTQSSPSLFDCIILAFSSALDYVCCEGDGATAMDQEENGYDISSPPWEEARGKRCGLELMTLEPTVLEDGAAFLRFVAERLLSLTDRSDNTSVTFLSPGEFSLDADTIWPAWVSNLSEAPLPVWILAKMEVSIRVNYLRHVEEKERTAVADRSMVNSKEVFVAGLKVARPEEEKHMTEADWNSEKKCEGKVEKKGEDETEGDAEEEIKEAVKLEAQGNPNGEVEGEVEEEAEGKVEEAVEEEVEEGARGEIESGCAASEIEMRAEDIEKVGAARAGLAVPQTISPNSGTTAPESAPMMTEVVTTVAAPIPLISVDKHLAGVGNTEDEDEASSVELWVTPPECMADLHEEDDDDHHHPDELVGTRRRPSPPFPEGGSSDIVAGAEPDVIPTTKQTEGKAPNVKPCVETGDKAKDVVYRNDGNGLDWGDGGHAETKMTEAVPPSASTECFLVPSLASDDAIGGNSLAIRGLPKLLNLWSQTQSADETSEASNLTMIVRDLVRPFVVADNNGESGTGGLMAAAEDSLRLEDVLLAPLKWYLFWRESLSPLSQNDENDDVAHFQRWNRLVGAALDEVGEHLRSLPAPEVVIAAGEVTAVTTAGASPSITAMPHTHGGGNGRKGRQHGKGNNDIKGKPLASVEETSCTDDAKERVPAAVASGTLIMPDRGDAKSQENSFGGIMEENAATAGACCAPGSAAKKKKKEEK